MKIRDAVNKKKLFYLSSSVYSNIYHSINLINVNNNATNIDNSNSKIK